MRESGTPQPEPLCGFAPRVGGRRRCASRQRPSLSRSPPCGELSPKATEGSVADSATARSVARRACVRQLPRDCIHHNLRVIQHVLVAEANHAPTNTSQVLGAVGIVFSTMVMA